MLIVVRSVLFIFPQESRKASTRSWQGGTRALDGGRFAGANGRTVAVLFGVGNYLDGREPVVLVGHRYPTTLARTWGHYRYLKRAVSVRWRDELDDEGN